MPKVKFYKSSKDVPRPTGMNIEVVGSTQRGFKGKLGAERAIAGVKGAFIVREDDGLYLPLRYVERPT